MIEISTTICLASVWLRYISTKLFIEKYRLHLVVNTLCMPVYHDPNPHVYNFCSFLSEVFHLGSEENIHENAFRDIMMPIADKDLIFLFPLILNPRFCFHVIARYFPIVHGYMVCSYCSS